MAVRVKFYKIQNNNPNGNIYLNNFENYTINRTNVILKSLKFTQLTLSEFSAGTAEDI
jgi:hypothetical protein